MKVVVAIDSLKGSLTSMEAGKAVEQGILRVHPQTQVVVKPLADGGEGTMDALIEGLGGERIEVTVTGPYGKPVKAYYGWLKNDNTAVMEMAAAAGITLSAERDPLRATLTPGIELILNAVRLEEELAGADIAVTGEGRLDGQTAMGKAPVGVAKLAKRHGLKVVAFAGSVTRDAAACNEAEIDAFFPIIRGVSTLEEAMDPENARRNMIEAVEQVFRII